MTRWTLFLDDERVPTSDFEEAVLCLDCEQAISMIAEMGVPVCISLDHDLGKNEDGSIKPSAMYFLKWLISAHLDCELDLTKVERVIVHSRNPAGAANLAGYWDSFASNFGINVQAEVRPRNSLSD